ncbi:PREDICTED: GDNF antisense RNA 1 (head to head) [Propithecus coquereli]|uniref:GDNF antisense RNA 1 (head to head) n=1 Tax=Propithecus coquereli TaxID=379532 RepID=UPI00063EF99C|nr:PREDICTED: GDNF antisense RNA 1 (head to head) [Propithecus coquereli]
MAGALSSAQQKLRSEQPPQSRVGGDTLRVLRSRPGLRGPGALREAQRRLPRSAPPRGAVPGSTRPACLMPQELRSCLEIRTRHHVNRRGESREDMRAPGAQAGRREPGLGGRGFPWFHLQLWLLFFVLRASEIALTFAVVMSAGMDSFLLFGNETSFQEKLLIVKGPHILKETRNTFSYRAGDLIYHTSPPPPVLFS